MKRMVKELAYSLVDPIQRMRLRGRSGRHAEHAALVWGYRRQPRPRTIIVDRDVRMHFRQVDHIPLLLYYLGSFEPYCLHFAEKILEVSEEKSPLILDVGGNIGFHALQFARLVQGRGQVLTIEASPIHAGTIRDNVALNVGRIAPVEVVNTAVGAAPGELTLSLPAGGNQGCYGANVVGGTNAFTCPVTTLDAIVGARNVTSIPLLKIDIEGSEMEALRGAEQTLEAFRPSVMVELNEEALQRCGASALAVKTFFADRGYAGFLMDADARGSPRLSRLAEGATRHDTDEALFVHHARVETLSALPI